MIATILTYWFYGAVIFFAVMIASEVMVAQVRGSDYIQWVQKGLDRMKTKKRTVLSQVLRWFFLWPLVFIVWAIAGLNGRSLAEQIVLDLESKEERQAAVVRRLRTLAEQIADAAGQRGQALWVPRLTKDNRHCYFRIVPYGDGLCVTHVVMKVHEVYIGKRLGALMPVTRFPALLKHEHQAMSLEAIVQACNGDSAWNDLCVPGRESLRSDFKQRS